MEVPALTKESVHAFHNGKEIAVNKVSGNYSVIRLLINLVISNLNYDASCLHTVMCQWWHLCDSWTLLVPI